MSGDTNVAIQVEEEQPKKRGVFSRIRRSLGQKIAGDYFPEHISKQWDRLHEVGGFLPMFVEGRLELRTQKQETVLEEIRADFEKCDALDEIQRVMSASNFKVFALFFVAGSQWLRGLSDRETAKKVKAYLELFQRIADLEAFTSDLFTCSIQMLHISWKPEDVGALPPYLIETKTVIQPTQQRGANVDEMKTY